MDKLEQTCHLIADAMDALDAAPKSRPASLTQTKLDEALMWAQRALREATPAINEASP